MDPIAIFLKENYNNVTYSRICGFEFSISNKEDDFEPYRPVPPVFSVPIGRPVQKRSDFVLD